MVRYAWMASQGTEVTRKVQKNLEGTTEDYSDVEEETIIDEGQN